MGSEKNAHPASAIAGTARRGPLSALLSQVLVAFTVEFDNEFERRMGEAGYPGMRLSLVLWANLLRFVGAEGRSVHGLATRQSRRGNHDREL